MNKGMPNAAKLGSKALLAAGGVTGVFGWILDQILQRLLAKASQQVLMYMDKGQVIFVVNAETKDFVEANDHAYAIVDQGKTLTKEEMDAIDQPVLNSVVKLATFNRLRVRKNT